LLASATDLVIFCAPRWDSCLKNAAARRKRKSHAAFSGSHAQRTDPLLLPEEARLQLAGSVESAGISALNSGFLAKNPK
jgi:hypothetical protein